MSGAGIGAQHPSPSPLSLSKGCPPFCGAQEQLQSFDKLRTDGSDSVEVLRSPLLTSVAHGFLGRRGGVSTGIHAGLNVGIGSDDDRAAIAENRARAVAAVLPGARLVTLHQVHSAEAVTVR